LKVDLKKVEYLGFRGPNPSATSSHYVIAFLFMQVPIQSWRRQGRRQDGGHRRPMTLRLEGSTCQSFIRESLPKAIFFPPKILATV